MSSLPQHPSRGDCPCPLCGRGQLSPLSLMEVIGCNNCGHLFEVQHQGDRISLRAIRPIPTPQLALDWTRLAAHGSRRCQNQFRNLDCCHLLHPSSYGHRCHSRLCFPTPTGVRLECLSPDLDWVNLSLSWLLCHHPFNGVLPSASAVLLPPALLSLIFWSGLFLNPRCCNPLDKLTLAQQKQDNHR